ncbi:hypothetical protein TBLA_0A05770 [Henningerozyma blattae CBS 6284]|uniref:Vacuolar protein sorting-associated protein 75 n=1 Tax=Henningerozyma blattae (strain ATCC 34711 / CBS 6284 / DSM 70876 / NBRC 10599 / NRRL Y-10934 / UCD 77-7) TaxID=1071380 RepID=I2GW68_HENB6|nr:hypothetical protein TBLA_0A05770 [Tetrapisispora blattae CBS 6284]CCH58370.1 hypothetical protein TBLA_0A05770 [Tetrapisispora blattae CBS 6284]
MSSNEEDPISKAFLGLAECEIETNKVEKKIEEYRLTQLKPIYTKRDEIISNIPGFWKIVLSQHNDFANYIRASDFKYIDNIESIKIDWINSNNFHIIIKFQGIRDDFPEQTIAKKCQRIIKEESDDLDEDIEEQIISEKSEIVWPKSYNHINPELIEDKTTKEGKKNYRMGMKSFFGWFKWTGLKPGKEFPHGDGLIQLIVDDLYPYCVRYYTEAQRDLADEASDSGSSEDEPLDLQE